MIADCWILLDKKMRIQSLNWNNPALEKIYADEWRSYLGRGLSEIAEIKLAKDQKRMSWRGEQFTALRLEAPDGHSFLLLKKDNFRDSLYEAVLDRMQDGIQIYDREASLVYLNKASRLISGIPPHVEVRGQHLMDLYELEEEISTVMTTLRTASPVINRFDNFKSTEGSSISSVNTGYPVFENNELIGAVVFEQNLESINSQIAKQEEIRETIKKKTSLPSIKFSGYHFSDLIGSNREFQATIKLAQKISPQNCSILLVGETGTGKEIFAQSIHKASDRKTKKFVAVNCAAVPETLIESMFFGTSRGSFTGSLEKPGLLEEANGGSLFLDELNSMSLSMQSKLLRVIQEGSFRRVGDSRDINCDIRFISSCNEEPEKILAGNILRKDLYYRLSTVTIEIPPLRERMDDIEELVEFYLNKRINHYAKNLNCVSPDVYERFRRYDWPGNIRELFNVLDYVLNTMEGDTVAARHLPRNFNAGSHPPAIIPADGPSLTGPSAGLPPPKSPDSEGQGPSGLPLVDGSLPRAIFLAEKKAVEEALAASRYNISRTASRLGLSRQSLQYRIKKYGIEL